MEAAILVILILNLIISSFLAYQLFALKKHIHSFGVEYSTSESHVEGLLKNQTKVTVYGQLKIGNLPIGRPFVFSEQVIEKQNREQVEALIQSVSRVLVSIGIRVLSKGTLK